MLIPVTLVAFLLVTAGMSVGALFLKYRIEHARSISASALRSRIGVDFGFDAIHAEGLRSLRVDGLRVDMPVPGMGQVTLTAESLSLSLSLSDILHAGDSIGHAKVTGAHLVVHVSEKSRDPSRSNTGEISLDPILSKLPPLDFQGDNCMVEVYLSSDKPPVVIKDVAFIATKEAESSEVRLYISATVPGGDHESNVKIDSVYRSPDILETMLEIDGFTPMHLSPVLEVPEGIAGTLAVRLHAFGAINKQMMVELALNLNNFEAPQLATVPDVIDLKSATLNAGMQLDIATRQLHIFQTTMSTAVFDAAVQGNINFVQAPAFFNITATIDDIPAGTIVNNLIVEKAAELGEVKVEVSPESRLAIRVSGPVIHPVVEAQATIPSVAASLTPSDKKLPKASVQLEQINVLWDSTAVMPTVTANLVDGWVSSAQLGVEAEKIAGIFSYDGERVLLHPITASISNKPWGGTVSYSVEDKEMLFDVNGTLTKIENTPLHDLVKKLWLGGDIAVNGRGSLGLDGRLNLQATADVTKGMVAFEWWLRKPAGVGASIHNIEVELIPRKTLKVTGEAAIEDTRILADLDYVYTGEKFEQKRIRVDVPHLEVNSAGKCVQIPYTARGETCRDAYYESNLVDGKYGDDIAKIGGHFDYVSFLPNNGANPLVCRDADVQVTLTDIKGVERSAALIIHAGEAHVPPFGDDWLLPLGPSEEYEEANPPTEPQPPQPWTYTLSADKIVVPPWEGTNFEAEVYSNDQETGFKFYRADAGNGHLEGTYLHEKQDNVMHLDATWDKIPATFLIKHLELPEVLAGDISGNIAYVVDRDDPRTTMQADGKFTVVNGHFIPEELAFMLADTLGKSFITLHPDALKFDEVSSVVNIEGDTINTTDLVIDTGGMRIAGDGVWVMEGDLDYNINVAITPDLAEQIPLLMDYFNVQGFRMTQQNIELGFHLTGPTFSPSGELAGLPPVGVTLVSGAAEMTGEAFKLLDTPRQMFMSIFRIGGGILGATRTQQPE